LKNTQYVSASNARAHDATKSVIEAEVLQPQALADGTEPWCAASMSIDAAERISRVLNQNMFVTARRGERACKPRSARDVEDECLESSYRGPTVVTRAPRATTNDRRTSVANEEILNPVTIWAFAQDWHLCDLVEGSLVE
jgi:hypothetical protein